MGNWLLLLCIGAMPLDADNRIEVLVHAADRFAAMADVPAGAAWRWPWRA